VRVGYSVFDDGGELTFGLHDAQYGNIVAITATQRSNPAAIKPAAVPADKSVISATPHSSLIILEDDDARDSPGVL
jgi:hypothetical protein